MRYTIALLLASTVLASGDHDGDHGHDHSHGGDGHAHDVEEMEGTEMTIVENADYRMDLKYWVAADAFGDNWLTFESSLVATADYTHHQYVSQWYQLADVDGLSEETDPAEETEGANVENEPDEPWWEMVQASLHWHEGETFVPGEDTSLQQTCGAKGQETWGNTTDYASRVEANADAADCSPWAIDLPRWLFGPKLAKAAFKRPLAMKASKIELKTGVAYPLRGGYYVQTDAAN